MFCKSVWNGIYIINDGYIRLCSIGANTKPELDMQRCRDKDGKVMHILTHDIKDIMNSDKHIEVRNFNLQNPSTWSPHCECCENREIITNFNRQHKNLSRRIYLMKIDNDNIVSENNFHEKSNDGKVNWMPNSLDIRFGNLCNQKCIMCGPYASNLWYDEYVNYTGSTSFGNGEKVTIIKNTNTGKWVEPPELKWYEDPRWWKKFEEMMPYLKHLYITGGEPMVVPAHDEMLDRLIKADFAKNIWLEYDSNCSAINDKITTKWNYFKRVDIRGSMDAIEDDYELIRYKGKWDKFVENIKILKEFKERSNKRIRLVALTSCFQISTAFNTIKSEEWCKSMEIDFHLRFLEGPSRHAVASLPNAAKQKLIDYYSQFINKSEKSKLIISHLNKHMGEKFYKPWAIKDYVKFMDFLDSSRNTNWKVTLPQVRELIEFSLNEEKF